VEGADRLQVTADVTVVPLHPKAQDPCGRDVTSHLAAPHSAQGESVDEQTVSDLTDAEHARP
jgi:hypothetical protein